METTPPSSQTQQPPPRRRRSSICGRDILLIPAAAFNKEKGIVNSLDEETISIHQHLIKVQYGFVNKYNRKDWIDTQTIDIKYDANGFNEAFTVYIPLDCSESSRLAYILYFAPLQRGREGFQTEARYLPLYSPVPTIAMEDPSPIFVKLPIANYAPHPFHETLYTIRLYNFLYDEQTNPNFSGVVQFVGKIKYIFYGFTEATDKDYLESPQRDIAWLNSENEYVEEGIIDITQQQHQHNGVNTANNKGAFVMNDLWVRLPNKKSRLVFKIGFEIYGGKQWEPAHLQSYHETQSFIYKPKTY